MGRTMGDENPNALQIMQAAWDDNPAAAIRLARSMHATVIVNVNGEVLWREPLVSDEP